MKKKILFIDRDGTIIKEPPGTFQVDTLDQLSFLPGAISNLHKISTEMDYDLVMVTNQDGLGTDTYPEAHFNTIQSKILEILNGEGILFKAIHIDTSYEHEQKDTRKPGTGMLTHYLEGSYDMKHSYVIGDRLTDVQLALNLGAQSILIKNTASYEHMQDKISFAADGWHAIYTYLKESTRSISHERNTTETRIRLKLDLDGSGRYKITTGLNFFNHMLEQFTRHSSINLELQVTGDLHVDEHHTIEDTAIVLGEAFLEATGNKKGIERFGYCLPMDDALAEVAIDWGGRNWLVWDADFKREYIGDMPTEMFFHFFKSFSDSAKCNIHICCKGNNEHHKIEAIFKAFAKALKMAIKQDRDNNVLPSTKGII